MGVNVTFPVKIEDANAALRRATDGPHNINLSIEHLFLECSVFGDYQHTAPTLSIYL